MESHLNDIGCDWLMAQVEELTEAIERMTPVEFNEGHRYIPQSVSRFSGFIDFSLTPYWVEILNCFDVGSEVREVAVKKGVQIAYTTALESILFYVAGHVRTVPALFATADSELAQARMENNIIPMFQHSGMEGIFQSADVDNTRKSGKTKNHLQWLGGGYMLPKGARNADKMRMFSIMFLLMDEIDAWVDLTKGGGDPLRLFKDRCAAFWEVRKILMGSTPLLKGSSKIDKQYKRGDQRKYKCRCLRCGYAQHLRWSGRNKANSFDYGFQWDYTDAGTLDVPSVRYVCKQCAHPHQEHDKPRFISLDNSFWEATAKPKEPGIRSYHLPAFYSPAGMQPWHKSVSLFLEAYDPHEKRTKDVGALQIFYNNVLGESFEIIGSKVSFVMVSGHRRGFYVKGEIPNTYIAEHCESRILFLTCTVDVHKNNLAVAVFGWTAGATCWLIDYHRIEDHSDAGCGTLESHAWTELQEIITERIYTADDGRQYKIALTLIDAGWSSSTVVDFCSQYEHWVYPIFGRERPAKAQRIQEFAEFTTQAGAKGYRITVDHYKDRLQPVLRRDWAPEMGQQRPYQFNAPMDTTDKELKELTVEYRREKQLPNGGVAYYWHRPSGVEQELWDLLIYGSASVEILAWMICTQHFGEDQVDWLRFWDFVEAQQVFFAPGD